MRAAVSLLRTKCLPVEFFFLFFVGYLGMLLQHPFLELLRGTLGKARLVKAHKVVVHRKVKLALGLHKLFHLLEKHLVAEFAVFIKAYGVSYHDLAVPELLALLRPHQLELLARQHGAEQHAAVNAYEHEHER